MRTDDILFDEGPASPPDVLARLLAAGTGESSALALIESMPSAASFAKERKGRPYVGKRGRRKNQTGWMHPSGKIEWDDETPASVATATPPAGRLFYLASEHPLDVGEEAPKIGALSAGMSLWQRRAEDALEHARRQVSPSAPSRLSSALVHEQDPRTLYPPDDIPPYVYRVRVHGPTHEVGLSQPQLVAHALELGNPADAEAQRHWDMGGLSSWHLRALLAPGRVVVESPVSEAARASEAKNWKVPDELDGMLKEAEGGDLASAKAALDWLKDHGHEALAHSMEDAGRVTWGRPEVHMVGPHGMARKVREHMAALALHDALDRVRMGDVPVVGGDLPRGASRKSQAKMARSLLRGLGMKGVSVTAPSCSMATTVDVKLPARHDYYLGPTRAGDAYGDGNRNHASRRANKRAERKLEAILDRAFPNHRDRSDYQSDYHNARWHIS